MAPFLAYATLLDWVYFSASVATSRSISAWEGSCVVRRRVVNDTCMWRMGYSGTCLFVLGDDVGKERYVDLGVVSALL